jgi:hypothetical protein
MRPSSEIPPFAVDESMIDQAAASLDISGRLAGHNGLLLLDVVASPDEMDPQLAFLAQALAGLHRRIQDDDDLADIEEALEYPLRAADQRGIDEACDVYRAMLASRLKSMLAGADAPARLAELHRAGAKP